MARVIDARFAGTRTLGDAKATEVFVTAADDIREISTSQGLASRLTLLDGASRVRQGPFAIVEFNTPASAVSSPVFRLNPGFTQGGLTAGGARELSLPNLSLNQLQDVTIRIVP